MCSNVTHSKLCVRAKKNQLSRSACALCAAHIHIRCQYRTSQIFKKNRHNSIKLLKQVEENAKTK